MSTNTKVVKLEISKPLEMTWGMFQTILSEIRIQTRFIMNKTIQFMWEFDGFSSEYKIEHGNSPVNEDILKTSKGNSVKINGYIYDFLKNKHILYSGNASQSQQLARKRWKSDINKVLKGEQSITSYKKNLPIDLHNKSIHIYNDKHGYRCAFNLLNKQGVMKYDLQSSLVNVSVKVRDTSTRTILDRILLKEYNIGASQIVYDDKKRKWFLLLTYIFENIISEKHIKENILGIDMGLVYPIYMAVNNSKAREKIEGGEIEQFRNKIEKRRISMLRQGKYSGEGRSGHGRATKIKPTEVLADKISNFRKTTNFKYAKFVVNFALTHKCGVIQMEDLSGISKFNTFLNNWSYYDLQLKITNKAKEHGIEVRKIKPNYTSQRCSCCGFIDKGNRPKELKGQSIFKCIQCDFETNADYNAAKNISMENIEQIIKNQLETQERHLEHHLKFA
jgi:putative transposase